MSYKLPNTLRLKQIHVNMIFESLWPNNPIFITAHKYYKIQVFLTITNVLSQNIGIIDAFRNMFDKT